MRRLEAFDPWLLAGLAMLLALGAVAVVSASLDVAAVHDHDAWRFAHRWFGYLLMATGVLVVTSYIPPEFWRKSAPWLALVSPVLLALPLVPGLGRELNGAARWISLGGMTVQPVELVRVLLVLYAAHLFAARASEKGIGLREAAPMLVLLLAIELVLLGQPDFGNAALLAGMVLVLAWVGGLRMRIWLFLIALGGLALALAVWLAPYRLMRLASFLDPWADPYGAGYQLAQSLLAYGAGGMVGVGIGQGVQKLFYLPEVFTDFIAAAIGEELGLLGVVWLISAYALIVLRLFALAFAEEDFYRLLLLVGTAMAIGLRAVVNLAVTMGLLPTKGLPLPFVSYGGSALLADAFLLGCAFAVQRRRRPRAAAFAVGAAR